MHFAQEVFLEGEFGPVDSLAHFESGALPAAARSTGSLGTLWLSGMYGRSFVHARPAKHCDLC